MSSFIEYPRHFIAPALLLLLCVVAALLPINWQTAFIFQREFAGSEPWRLFTANSLHTNTMHLLLNGAGLAMLTLLFQRDFSATRLLLLLLTSGLTCTLGIWAFSPNIDWYVGLSGALHGVFIGGAILDIRRRLLSGWLLLIGVVAKIGWEQLHGAEQFLAQLIEANVAIDAHLYGAFGGLLVCLWQIKNPAEAGS